MSADSPHYLIPVDTGGVYKVINQVFNNRNGYYMDHHGMFTFAPFGALTVHHTMDTLSDFLIFRCGESVKMINSLSKQFDELNYCSFESWFWSVASIADMSQFGMNLFFFYC